MKIIISIIVLLVFSYHIQFASFNLSALSKEQHNHNFTCHKFNKVTSGCQHVSPLLLRNMITFWILFFVCPHLITSTKATIIDLDDNNFQDELKKCDLSLVIFHAPWCGQCKKLMMKLTQIHKELQQTNPSINIFKVDCEDNGKETCEQHKITGFPILKSFRKNEEYGKFEGNREVDEIVNFMRIEAAPIAKELKDFTNLETILKQENRVCLVATLRKRSKLEVIFTALAEKLRRKISFLYTYTDIGDSWIKLYQVPILWNKFENNFVEYNGEEDILKLESFILKNFNGLVGIRTFSNRNEFNFPLVTTYYEVDYKRSPKITNYWRNRVLKVAMKYKDKFNFAISSRNEYYEELKDLSINNFSEERPVVVVTLDTKEKFVLKENFSVETFDLFLHNILHGMLNPHLKSQEVPKKADSYVVSAVGSTFYDLVINNTNDTMVKLYAEWCGHCRSLAPVYKKLAKLMRHEKITFVEVNAVENDVPLAYTPTGYPTIYWSTKEYRMSPILYEGDRSIEDFVKFIAKHSSNELRDYDREGKLKTSKTEL